MQKPTTNFIGVAMIEAILRQNQYKTTMSKLKLLLVLMLLIASIPMFSSCSGDDDAPNDTLCGTEWTRASLDEVEHLDFTSDNNVDYFYTRDGAVSGRVGSGTYVKNGNEIVFQNLSIVHDFMKITIKSATITGTTMNVTYDWGSTEFTSTFRQSK